MKNANPVSSWSRAAAVAILVVALAGCGPGKSPDAPIKTVWDHFPFDLGGHPVSLQVAVLQAEQERGLMQRPDLAGDNGMIFVYAAPQSVSYWMRNTPEPLDIAYIGPDGVIAEIYHMLPLDERPIASMNDQVKYAVEMPQGWYEAHGVRPGARLNLKGVSDALAARGFDVSRFGFR